MPESLEEADRENGKVRNFFRVASRCSAAAAALCFATAYAIAPDEGYEYTAEYADKKQILRMEFESACAEEASMQKQTIQECMEDRAHRAAINSQYSYTNGLLILLTAMFSVQAAALRTGQWAVDQRIKRSTDMPSLNKR